MSKNVKLFAAIVSAFAIGFSISNMAVSDVPSKIAVVDVPQVVSASSQVMALKNEQQAKAKELVTFLEKARKDVAATTDTKKKQTLEEKYTKELNEKRAAIDKNYNEKLSEIDNAISVQIANQAKMNGYDIVLAKGVVLYGGNDITEEVKQAVNASEKASTAKKPAAKSKKR